MTDWKWSLPRDLQTHLESQWDRFEHPGLLIDKFAPYAFYEWQRKKKGKLQNFSGWGLGTQDNKKNQWLTDCKNRFGNAIQQDLINHSAKRWYERVDHFVDDVNKHVFSAITKSPLIVGLGGEHVLETAITLDHNSGTPIIPGSALKGLARAAALIDRAQRLLDKDSNRLENLKKLDDLMMTPIPDRKQEREAYLEKWQCISINRVERDWLHHKDEKDIRFFQRAFGTMGQAGQAVFFEGICKERVPKLATDIVNPHFGKYYGEQRHNGQLEAPRDDDNPTPVTYLTVEPGQLFTFAVVPRQKGNDDTVQQVIEWLKSGLTLYGVGAKTSQGYGLFEEIN